MDQIFDNLCGLNCFLQDGSPLSLYHWAFESDGDPLTAANTETQVSTDAELKDLLSSPTANDHCVSLYVLHQGNSFGSLKTTSSAFARLVEKHGLDAGFLRLTSSFHRKTSDNATSCIPPASVTFHGTKLEYGYVMKYPELNGRDMEPWSLRQLCFYHQFDTYTNKSVMFLLLPRPPTNSIALSRVRETLSNVISLTDFGQLYLRLNEAILTTYTWNWRDCMCDYQTRLQRFADATMEPCLVENKSVSPQHLATLHFLHGQTLPLHSALSSLEETISTLRSIKVVTTPPIPPPNVLYKSPEQFESIIASVRAYKTNASALLKRWEVTVNMVDTTLSLTDQKLSLKQNSLVTALGRFTASDSASIHVITIITLVFLCFSVVSAILDMPFFYLDSENNLQTALQFWIYPVLSVPLTLACVGYWRWEVLKKRKQQEDLFQKHGDGMA